MGVPLTLSSVPAQTPYVQYVSGSGQTVFPYPFEITQDSDLIVLLNGAAQPTDGGYTLSGQGATGGGNVIFTVGLTLGVIVTLYRNVQISRVTQLSQNGTFFSANFNNEFNRIYLIMQQLQQSLLPGGNQAYALMVPNSNNPPPTTLLTPGSYANKYLAFDSNGNPTPALLTSSGSLTQQIIAGLLTPQTPAEISAAVVPVNLFYAPGNVLRYATNTTPGVTVMDTAFQAAVSQCAIQGGADVFVPPGTYLINGTISATNPQQAIRIHGAGENISVIVKGAFDTDLFSFSASGVVDVPAMFVIESLRIGCSMAMTTGAAFRFTDTSNIPSVVMRDVFIICAGSFTFAYGVVTIDCNEAFYENVKMYGLSSAGVFVGWNITSTGAGAPSNKFFGCSVANAKYGVYIQNSHNPGIEGTQFYGCDFYFVNTGVLAINSTGGYVPPGITWMGGHINATFKNFDIRVFTQVTIQGALLYNTDSSGLGAIFGLTTVGDANIQGNLCYGGTAANIFLLSWASGPTHGGIIANNVGYVAAAYNFISMAATNVTDFTIANNVQYGGANTVLNTSGAGTLDVTVNIYGNTPDLADVYDNASILGAATMSLVGYRAPVFILGTPGGATTCTKLTSRGAYDEVTLIATGANLTLQHNGSNPDGFALQGGVNFVFGTAANTTKIHLKKLNGGYWTEMWRN